MTTIEPLTPSHWLTQRKTQSPRLRAELLQRPRLVQQLRQAVHEHRLTLLNAPTGYGKSTLAATALADLSGYAVTWLVLEEEDNDVTLFWPALVAALQQVDASCGQTLAALWGGQGTPNLTPRRLMALLLNEIAATITQPFVLVLDDLHLLQEPALVNALELLVERLPTAMRLVATTRHTPALALARLRAQGEVAEIGADALAFTPDEIEALVNQQLHLALTPDELRLLHSRSEGWAAGVRLLTAALTQEPGKPTRHDLTDKIARSQRHLFELLVEEVLARQPAAVRTFLLETAILHELTASLCQAVTGREDAARLLEEVYRRNLFLSAINAHTAQAEESFRYHALFQEMLLKQLLQERPHLVRELHRRAGLAHPVPDRALHHLLMAQAWDEARQHILQLAEVTFAQGMVNRLAGWIEALPPAQRVDHPWLTYFLGLCAWSRSKLSEAETHLSTALQGFEAQHDRRGIGEAQVLLSVFAQTAGNYPRAARYLQSAQGFPLSPRSQAQLAMSQAWLALGMGEAQRAADQLRSALTVAESSADPGAFQIVVMQTRAVFATTPTGTSLLVRTLALIDQTQPAPTSPWQAGRNSLLAFLHFWRGDFQAARLAAEETIAGAEPLGGLPWATQDLLLLLPVLYQWLGDLVGAERAIHDLRASLNEYPAWYAARAFSIALVYWEQERLADLAALDEELKRTVCDPEWAASPFARTVVGGLRALADRQPVKAVEAFRNALAIQTRFPICRIIHDARLALAYAYHQQRQDEAALPLIAELLTEAARPDVGYQGLTGAPRRLLEPLLDLAIVHKRQAEVAITLRSIIEQANQPRPVAIPGSAESLSAREVEVLRLMASGAGNQAIADQLVVSLATVKTHVAHILAKLAVANRGEAIAKARQLRLL